MTEGKNRYNAAVVEWSKRVTHGFGGRVSYTYSVLKDNQIGESNFYSAGGDRRRSTTTTTSRACRRARPRTSPPATTRTRTTATSLLDVPHRVIIAPMFELPFGKGKKYGANSSGGGLDPRRLDDRRRRSTCRAGSR